jgi:hypothetical protein
MLQVAPPQFTLMRPAAHPPRAWHVVPPEGPDRRGGRPRPPTGAHQEAAGILDLPVGIEDDTTIVRLAKANGPMEFQSCPAGVAEHAAL